jgi:hypothetical protein
MDRPASEFASPILGKVFVPDERRTERTMGGALGLTNGSIPPRSPGAA